jgi:hypothetical protein
MALDSLTLAGGLLLGLASRPSPGFAFIEAFTDSRLDFRFAV